MSIKISRQTGNWSTAATWGSVTNSGVYSGAYSGDSISIGSTFVYGDVFTAPNTSTSAEKLIISVYPNTYGGSATTEFELTINLEEFDGVDTWTEVASATLNSSSDFTDNAYGRYVGLVALQITPYTFTTTAAGYYRMGIKKTNITGTPVFYCPTRSSKAALMCLDDRTGVPSSTDDVIIMGDTSSTVTVTLDGTRSIGSNPSVTYGTAYFPFTGGVSVIYGGTLKFDTTANSQLTVDGHFTVRTDGYLEVGTEANPIPKTYTAKIYFDCSTYDRKFVGYGIFGGISICGDSDLTSETWKGKVSSGDGTAADPVILEDAVDWNVGDRIHFAPTSTLTGSWNRAETKYIITKNSSTSYVLSDTQGGAESAFVNEHDGADAFNLTRNVGIYRTSGSTKYIENEAEVFAGASQISDAKIVYKYADIFGVSDGVFYTGTSSIAFIGENYTFEFLVISDYEYRGIYITDVHSNTNRVNFESCFIGETTTGNEGITISGSGINLNNCGIVSNWGGGVVLNNQPSNINISNCIFSGHGNAGVSVSDIKISSVVNLKVINCRFYCSRVALYLLGATGANAVIDSCDIQTIGQVIYELGYRSAITTTIDILFLNCKFPVANKPDTYIQEPGNEMRFHNIEQTDNRHILLKADGYAQSAGIGLVDTTKRKNYCLKIVPTNTTSGAEMSISFKVPAQASSAVNVIGYLKRNSNLLTNEIRVDLYLPNSFDVADSYTLPTNSTDWQIFTVTADNTDTVDGLATVIVSGIYENSGGAFYLADIYNGNNSLTAMDVWERGSISPYMNYTLGNPREVWDVINTGHATNSMGELVSNIDTNVKSNRTDIINTQAIVATKT